MGIDGRSAGGQGRTAGLLRREAPRSADEGVLDGRFRREWLEYLAWMQCDDDKKTEEVRCCTEFGKEMATYDG